MRTCGICGRELTAKQPSFCSRTCSNARGRRAAPVDVVGDVARIVLPDGSVAVVDAVDADAVRGQPWRRQAEGYVGYSLFGARREGRRTARWVFLHRVVARTPDGMVTDHIDGDPLNNRRSNLRVVGDAENAKNKRTRGRTKTSQYKGVHRYRASTWAAKICVDYRPIHLGYFRSEEDAARAYDSAAVRWHGEYAALNFPTH